MLGLGCLRSSWPNVICQELNFHRSVGLTGGLKSGLARINWNNCASGPKSTLFSCDVSNSNLIIVWGSRLKLRGNPGEVTPLWPSAWIGWAEASILGIVPSVKPWKVAVAPSLRRLMLAVNGFASVKEVVATPVSTILMGNVSEALVIKFWWIPGIVTGDRCIWESAGWSDSMPVDRVDPAMVVSASTPWRKFCNKARPADNAPPRGA